MASRKPQLASHNVLAYTPRTEDTIRAHIAYSICFVINKSGDICDPSRKPSDYWKTDGTWLSRAQDMAQHLRQNYPAAKITNRECKPYYKKALTAFADLLFDKIIKK